MIVVDLWKLPELKLGQVGAGLDPGLFAPKACVSGASNITLRIAPLNASGRRMLLTSLPPSFVRAMTVTRKDEWTMSASPTSESAKPSPGLRSDAVLAEPALEHGERGLAVALGLAGEPGKVGSAGEDSLAHGVDEGAVDAE